MPRRSAAILTILLLSACQPNLYDPARATRAYPFDLHHAASVDIQLFRDGEHITLYNATATSYSEFDLWLNQRFVAHVASLPAGGNITLSLWDFWDERGEVINAGGLLRVDEPTPIRLAEIQIGLDQPLVGLITIRAEPVD